MTEGSHNVKIIRSVKYYVSPRQAQMVMPLWRRGHDTKTIADFLALPEYAVAKQLAEMRDRAWSANAE